MTFLKKLKIINFLYEKFILFSEYIFKPISKVFEFFSNIKLIRRLIFNLIPRNKNILINTKYGDYILNTNSRIIAKKTFNNKEPYSANSVKNALDILRKEDIKIEYFVDVGANVGTSSISASFMDEELKFICIEGNEDNFGLLSTNVKINKLEDRFLLKNSLVGENNQSRIFVEFKEEKGCSRVFEDKDELNRYTNEFGFSINEATEITTEKLKGIIEHVIDKNLFLWIDLEGLDLEILKSEISNELFPLFFEFNPTFYKIKFKEYKNYIEEIENHLINCGYKSYFAEVNNLKKEEVGPNFLLNLINSIGENKGSTNILLI